jgi:hypothetical protein
MLLHTRASASFAAAFQGELPEYLAYLGWPMLLVLAAVAVWRWRLLPVRATAVTFAVLEILSLGGSLLADGHEHAWLKLPWYWLQTLPVIGSAVTDRFSILADGAAAVLFAFGLDAAWARWPGARWPVARWPAAHWAVAVAAVAAIAPIVPRPLPDATVSSVPAGWSTVFTRLRLPAGASVLVLPIPLSTFTEPLRWTGDTGVPSAMVGGYFMGPNGSGHAEIDGAGASPQAQYLNQLWMQSSPGTAGQIARYTASTPPTARAMRAQLAAWHPAAVVAVTSERSPLGRYLTGLLGPPAVRAGSVLGWHLRSLNSGSTRSTSAATAALSRPGR